MKLTANRKNLRKYAKDLLGNECTPEKEAELINECMTGFVREPGHISHSRFAHINRIDSILGNHGVEGMLLDKHGEDCCGDCSERRVALDVCYSNTGDTYGMTVMYVNGKLCIGDWGGLVERLA